MALDVLDSAPSSSPIPRPTGARGFRNGKAPEEVGEAKTGDAPNYAYGYGEHEQDLHDDWVTGPSTGLLPAYPLEEEDAEADEADEADEDAEDAE